MKQNGNKTDPASENIIALAFALGAEEIARAACGAAAAVNGGWGGECAYLSTDSRAIVDGCIFAAIAGENFDGCDYAAAAAEAGARIIIAERMPDGLDGKAVDVVIVKNTVRALGDLARYAISRSGMKTVAVTGSVGKTTTKEFVASCFSVKHKTHKTDGNKNNEIGLPLTALSAQADDEYGVFECGMSGRGQIEYLSGIVNPDAAIITNIGTAHIEALGSRENIARAKLEIVSGMKPDGVLVINGDEPLLYGARDTLGVKVVTAAMHNRDADFRAVNLRRTASGTVFDLIYMGKVETNLEIPTLGAHTVYDALFAIAVSVVCGLSMAEIRVGLRSYRGVSMRQRIYGLGGITVIEDCYNASPESMRASIDVLVSVAKEKGGRAAALLGDMRELGEHSRLLHEQIGVYAARAGVTVLFTYGQIAENIATAAISNGVRAENVYVNPDCTNPAPTGDMILGALAPGDVLLVKASRAVAAEAVIEYMKEKTEKTSKR